MKQKEWMGVPAQAGEASKKLRAIALVVSLEITKEGLEPLGRGNFEDQTFEGARMVEGESEGMKRLSLEFDGKGNLGTIDGIPDDRMALVGHVYPNLVGAARREGELK